MQSLRHIFFSLLETSCSGHELFISLYFKVFDQLYKLCFHEYQCSGQSTFLNNLFNSKQFEDETWPGKRQTFLEEVIFNLTNIIFSESCFMKNSRVLLIFIAPNTFLSLDSIICYHKLTSVFSKSSLLQNKTKSLISQCRPKYNYLFLSQERLSGRSDVTSDKVNFRPDIRQNIFLKKIRISRVYEALKTIRRYFTLINVKLR